MSSYYGCFLEEGTAQYNHYYAKYTARAEAIIAIAEDIKDEFEVIYPNARGVVIINYQNAYISMGRYFNDVIKFISWHKIELTHRSKMIAHMIKWLRLSPIFSHSIKMKEWIEMDAIMRTAIMDLNHVLMMTIIQYVGEYFNVELSDAKQDLISEELKYYIKTDAYHERMATLWFEEILK